MANYYNDKFKVQTPQGPEEVNIADLEKHYMDQAHAGQVTFATGPNVDKGNFSQIFGMPFNKNTQPSAKTTTIGTGDGEKILGNVKIQIDPTNWLKQFFNFTSSGTNIPIGSAAANNYPPEHFPDAGNLVGSFYSP